MSLKRDTYLYTIKLKVKKYSLLQLWHNAMHNKTRIFIAIISGTILTVFITGYIPGFTRVYDFTRWNPDYITTTATVVSHHIGGFIFIDANIVIEYLIQEKTYQNRIRMLSDRLFVNWGEEDVLMEELNTNFPIGKRIDCYYHKDDPNRVTIHQVRFEDYRFILTALTFVTGFIYTTLYLGRC